MSELCKCGCQDGFGFGGEGRMGVHEASTGGAGMKASGQASSCSGLAVRPVQAHPFSVDGERIHGEFHAASVPRRGSLLLVHGFNSCLDEFGDLPTALASQGFDVFGYDQRGFGDSEGETGLTSHERFDADLDAAVAQLAGLSPGQPVGVVAHSFGAAMVLARMGRPHPFVAVCLAHPVLDLMAAMPPWKRPGLRLLARWNAVRTRRGGANLHVRRHSNYDRLFVDAELAQQHYAKARYHSASVNAGVHAVARKMDPVAWAGKVTVPALAILGPNDALIPYEDSRQVVAGLQGDVESIEHRGGHSCFRDLDAGYLAGRVGDWFNGHMEAVA